MLDYWSLGTFTFPAPARVNCYIQFSFNIELGSLTTKSVSVSKCLKWRPLWSSQSLRIGEVVDNGAKEGEEGGWNEGCDAGKDKRGSDCSPDLEKGEVTAGDWGQKGSWCPLTVPLFSVDCSLALTWRPLTALSFPPTLPPPPFISPGTSFRHVLSCPHINPPVYQALGSRVSSVRKSGAALHPEIHQVSEIRGKAGLAPETKDKAPASPQGYSKGNPWGAGEISPS